jgi:dienelactone hydrolase
MLINTLSRALAATLSLFLLLAGAGALAQAPSQIPVDAFFQNPSFSGGILSPNGRHLAIKVAPKGGRAQLVVIDVEKLSAKAVAQPTDVDIAQVFWVNDDRLVFTVWDTETAIGDTRLGSGLYAVSRDASDFRQLIDRDDPGIREIGVRARTLRPDSIFMNATTDRNSDDIFVAQGIWDINFQFDAINVLRLNTKTGLTTSYLRPGKSVKWVVDSKDVPRVSMTYEDGRIAIHHLGADGKWNKLSEFDQHSPSGFDPLALAPDGSLYVLAHNGRDKEALYRYDLEKKALDPEPIVSLKDYDLDARLIMGKAGPVGVRYVSDARATIWFDPKWKEVQAQVDKLLPNTVNDMEVPLRGELPLVVVRAFSDVDPGNYMLFNTQTGKLTVLGPAQREIDPRRMARRDMVRFKARDGLEIPAWLTLPKDAKGKKVPLIVLVHGGPWVRAAEWKWDAESQFLASRGYAVLEPEFRGSTGFGFKHFKAGWKQWGLKMQDDIADAAKWAIAQGTVDPARICIAGASYGGYATLMGLANDPELFKCGINWVGVSDIDMMYSVNWSDSSTAWKTYGMPVLVGDREKDAEQLKKTSPLLQAARIKQPLLMAYGGADRRVPIVHGTRFRSAVEKTNPNVEWIEYTEEGHGWGLVKNRIDFWTRVEKFLEKNIGAR